MLAFTWVLLGVALALTTAGEAAPSFVRFSAALAAGVSLSSAIRLYSLGNRRGDNWNGALVSLPLPFFDSELRAPVARTTAGLALIPGLASLLAIVLLVAAAAPPERGHIVIDSSRSSYAWADENRGGLGRELPGQIDVARLDVAAGVLQLEASRIGSDWSSSATLAPGVGVELGPVTATWAGLVPSESIGRVTLEVRRGDERTEVLAEVGGVVDADGTEVRVLNFEENRLGALGPAVLVSVDDTEAWLHLWGPEVHHRFAVGPTVSLTDIESGVSALLVVQTTRPSWLFPVLATLIGLLVACAARLATRPVFVRGRSGDYQLVGPTRASVLRTARRALGEDAYREWTELLVQLRRAGSAK